MIIWKYKIQTDAGIIITQNPEYAEKWSRLGKKVFCKRENNIYHYKH